MSNDLLTHAALEQARVALSDAIGLIKHKQGNPKVQEQALELVETALAGINRSIDLTSVEKAMESTLFNKCRAILGTSNWAQDDALRRLLAHLFARNIRLDDTTFKQ